LDSKNIVPKYKSIWNGFKEILKTEGIRGLYRGVILTTIVKNMNKAFFFGMFGIQNEKYQKVYGPNSRRAIF